MGRKHNLSSHISQDHLDLVSRIYNLPLCPEGLQGALDDFAPMVNGAMAGTAVYGPLFGPLNLNAVTSNLEPSFLEDLRQIVPGGYQSPFNSLMQKPNRKFVQDIEMHGLESIEQYAQRPIIQWLKQNHNLFHGVASRLNLHNAWTDILFVMYSADRGPASEQEIHIGNLFLDHFAKAIELGRAFDVLKSRFNGTFSMLDRFHIGIFVLGQDGSVVIKNAEAERIVDTADGLSISREGHLRPANHEQRAALKDAITKAVGTAQANNSYAESLLTISRCPGTDPYLVEVSPICDKDEIESHFRGCLVFVIDPTKTDVVSTDGMQALYSLTNSESEVCKLLAEGFGTDNIADARNLTRETVRNYIKKILQKTGTQNRSQLVRLALNVNLPIDPVSREEN